ncbi:MAG TPA: hypothetical protein VLV56_01970 [Burkholderiales bacterium]|nr:hypothetical protein [Burkholderiales bacterium]
MRPRKSSLRVVLIGAAALTACDSGPRYTNRDIYASAEECQKDWGRPENCEPAYRTGSGYGGGGSRVWYGPNYDSNASTARSPRAIGTSSVSRGGFGSSSAFHGAGG